MPQVSVSEALSTIAQCLSGENRNPTDIPQLMKCFAYGAKELKLLERLISTKPLSPMSLAGIADESDTPVTLRALDGGRTLAIVLARQKAEAEGVPERPASPNEVFRGIPTGLLEELDRTELPAWLDQWLLPKLNEPATEYLPPAGRRNAPAIGIREVVSYRHGVMKRRKGSPPDDVLTERSILQQDFITTGRALGIPHSALLTVLSQSRSTSGKLSPCSHRETTEREPESNASSLPSQPLPFMRAPVTTSQKLSQLKRKSQWHAYIWFSSCRRPELLRCGVSNRRIQTIAGQEWVELQVDEGKMAVFLDTALDFLERWPCPATVKTVESSTKSAQAKLARAEYKQYFGNIMRTPYNYCSSNGILQFAEENPDDAVLTVPNLDNVTPLTRRESRRIELPKLLHPDSLRPQAKPTTPYGLLPHYCALTLAGLPQENALVKELLRVASYLTEGMPYWLIEGDGWDFISLPFIWDEEMVRLEVTMGGDVPKTEPHQSVLVAVDVAGDVVWRHGKIEMSNEDTSIGIVADTGEITLNPGNELPSWLPVGAPQEGAWRALPDPSLVETEIIGPGSVVVFEMQKGLLAEGLVVDSDGYQLHMQSMETNDKMFTDKSHLVGVLDCHVDKRSESWVLQLPQKPPKSLPNSLAASLLSMTGTKVVMLVSRKTDLVQARQERVWESGQPILSLLCPPEADEPSFKRRKVADSFSDSATPLKEEHDNSTPVKEERPADEIPKRITHSISRNAHKALSQDGMRL
ncbi:MAG: hypothetical protein KVP17_004990 [Porospora cf. gigantea B]|uniref:uncharacterized protein n=2 Tax=Porospora cf. gigantea B TaxID=2853592 RepID=UPI0035718136|nr:MAG: hypothetical protein KVP17_004990 [Porospora cf. gigantea B]